MMTLKQLPPASGLITRWSGPLGDIFRLQLQVEELTAILQRINFVSNQYITPKTISKKKQRSASLQSQELKDEFQYNLFWDLWSQQKRCKNGINC